METDSPHPLRSVEPIPHSCTVYTPSTHGPLPSTMTPSGLGRSEESEGDLERDSILESASMVALNPASAPSGVCDRG